MENRLPSASQQPSSEREPCRLSQVDSMRRKRAELASVEAAIGRIENKKGEKKYSDPTFRLLLDRRRDLSFDLLPKKGREELVERIFSLEAEKDKVKISLDSVEEEIKRLADFSPEKYEKINLRSQLDIKLSELKRQIVKLSNLVPAIILKKFQQQRTLKEERESQERIKEQTNSFFERYDITAKEAVFFGIKQLSKTLERIFSSTGGLPSVLFFPDTGSRPLRYAVNPLIKYVYLLHGQPMPREVFLKTFSRFQEAEDREIEIQKLQDEVRNLKKEIKEMIQKRKSVIYAIRGQRHNSEKYINLSLEAQKLQNKIDSLEVLLSEKEKLIFDFLQEKDKKIFTNRLSDSINKGHEVVLVIDDVSSGGRTFAAIDESLTTLGLPNQAYYFSFLSTRPNNLNSKILSKNISAGVCFSGDESNVSILAEKILGNEESNSPDREWGELMLAGFPYRHFSGDGKEKTIGVKKNQFSLNPYSEVSPNRNPEAVRQVREKYRVWGEEAVKQIFTAPAVENAAK
jgi:hypothetical protein